VKRYKFVIDAQQQLIRWFPQFDNFFRTDALNQFLIGEEDGKPWKKELETAMAVGYWIFQGKPNNYDVIGSLRDKAVKTWSTNQYKDEIKTGDRVIIWVTGESSGCYALATVISEVERIEEDMQEAAYRLQPTDKRVSPRVRIQIDHNLWNAPVLREELEGLPEFSDFPAGKQGTNLKMTKDHFEGILSLVLGRT